MWHCDRRAASAGVSLASPPHRTRDPLDGPGDGIRHPAAIEATRLGRHDLAVDLACIHGRRVDRHTADEIHEAGGGIRVRPPCASGHDPTTANIEVRCRALVLAERRAAHRVQSGRDEVGDGQVVDGRVTGLEHTNDVAGVEDDLAAEPDDDVRVDVLEARWSRVVPDGLLACTNGIGCGATHGHSVCRTDAQVRGLARRRASG